MQAALLVLHVPPVCGHWPFELHAVTPSVHSPRPQSALTAQLLAGLLLHVPLVKQSAGPVHVLPFFGPALVQVAGVPGHWALAVHAAPPIEQVPVVGGHCALLVHVVLPSLHVPLHTAEEKHASPAGLEQVPGQLASVVHTAPPT